MHLSEYGQIKNLTYLEYCDYLQKKYGVGKADYMTKSYNKNNKVSRTCDGLFAHHKYEDHAIMLSEKDYAMYNPFEWQLAENIVYCNYLEHLFLHMLICEYPAPDRNPGELVGTGGIENFIVPELNDLYSGWVPNQAWKQRCFSEVKENKDTYLVLLQRYKARAPYHNLNLGDHIDGGCVCVELLLTSFNEHYGLWSKNNNEPLFQEIREALTNI